MCCVLCSVVPPAQPTEQMRRSARTERLKTKAFLLYFSGTDAAFQQLSGNRDTSDVFNLVITKIVPYLKYHRLDPQSSQCVRQNARY